jgi:hypothetical protein
MLKKLGNDTRSSLLFRSFHDDEKSVITSTRVGQGASFGVEGVINRVALSVCKLDQSKPAKSVIERGFKV